MDDSSHRPAGRARLTPVWLRGRDGSELRLDLVGYQFPAVEADPWDSNSLLVKVRVVSAQGSWEAVDPCLTTWEAEHLQEWLTALAAGDERAVIRAFNQPNVRMSVNGLAPDFSRARLHACFELETRPPWLPGPAAGRDTLCVDLDLPRASLRDAAVDLAKQLERFPRRGDDPTL
jgi:hypothetical protein